MAFMSIFRHVGVSLLSACLLSPLLCFAKTEGVFTVQIAPEASQKYSLLLNDDDTNVESVWVLFTGSDGYVHMGLLDGQPVFIGRGILVDGRGLFLRRHNAVAVVDSPSVMPKMPLMYRTSEAYLSGTEKVISAIQAQVPAARIYFVGTSNGSMSVIALAARLGSRIAGTVVLSGIFNDPAQLKDLGANQRVLFVHHERDACVPPRFTPAFRERFHPVIVEDMGVHYAGDCGPYSAHEFHGQESAVVDLVYQWSEARSIPERIRPNQLSPFLSSEIRRLGRRGMSVLRFLRDKLPGIRAELGQ
jgi:dienelactone hydrolase